MEATTRRARGSAARAGGVHDDFNAVPSFALVKAGLIADRTAIEGFAQPGISP